MKGMGDVWRSWCLAGATCLGKLYDARLVHFMQACVDSCGGCVVLVVVVVVPHIFVWGSYFLGLSRLLSSPSPPSPSPPPAPSPPPPPPSLLFAHSLITLTHHALTTHSPRTHSSSSLTHSLPTDHHHSSSSLTHHACRAHSPRTHSSSSSYSLTHSLTTDHHHSLTTHSLTQSHALIIIIITH